MLLYTYWPEVYRYLYMKDFLVDNKSLYDFQYNFLTCFSYIIKISLVLYIIGAFSAKSAFILQINFLVNAFIGLFLLYRFSSRRIHKIQFTELDRKIAYSAGLYIIVVSLSDFFSSLTETTRNHDMKILQPYKKLKSKK
jgi:hypothetical protein